MKALVHEVRKSVDWLAKLQECLWTLLVHPLCPQRNRCRREQKDISRLLERPAASGPNCENRPAFSRSGARPSVRCDYCHASILETEFFPQPGDLLLQPILLGSDSETLALMLLAAPPRARVSAQ